MLLARAKSKLSIGVASGSSETVQPQSLNGILSRSISVLIARAQIALRDRLAGVSSESEQLDSLNTILSHSFSTAIT